MKADGVDDLIRAGIDDGDGAVAVGGAGVDYVDLVLDGVDGHAGGVCADLEGAVGAEVDEVQNGDGVGAAVRDVGELAVAGGDVGEVGAAAGGEAEQGGGESELGEGMHF